MVAGKAYAAEMWFCKKREDRFFYLPEAHDFYKRRSLLFPNAQGLSLLYPECKWKFDIINDERQSCSILSFDHVDSMWQDEDDDEYSDDSCVPLLSQYFDHTWSFGTSCINYYTMNCLVLGLREQPWPPYFMKYP